jgi:nitroreductase
MELAELLRRRRMTRSFTDEPVAPDVLERVLDATRRAPSAGNTQGFDLLVLVGPEQTARYWDASLPAERRAGFAYPGLLRAPVLVLPVPDREAYLERYAEDDKARSGLGGRAEAWPVPYWDVDTAFATMLLMLAAADEGLGVLFFGLFRQERAVLDALRVPEGRRPIGAVALGHPDPTGERPGRSSGRRRRPLDEVVRWGSWS